MESPFQLIQTIDLVSESKNNILVVRLNELERNNLQLKKIVELFGLADVRYLKTKYKFSLLFYFFWILFFAIKSNELYIGDENSIVFRMLKRIVDNKKIWLLDDGVSTLNSEANSIFKRLTIFSNVGGSHNSLGACRSLIESRSGNRRVNLVVGSKLVEEGICSKEIYHSLLEEILDDAQRDGIDIVYVPHRGEAIDNVREVSEKFDFDVVENSLPIELISLEFDILPIKVFSVLSTALYSMSLIYDNTEFRVYPLKLEDIVSRRNAIENLYRDMRENTKFFDYLG